MPTRLAACDPCRVSKLACDHERPVCSRCRDSGRDIECSYRLRPFKKRKVSSFPNAPNDGPNQQRKPASPHESAALPRVTSQRSRYPNPGYLGSSSHATIYNHLSPEERSSTGITADTGTNRQLDSTAVVDDVHLSHGALALEQIHGSTQIEACRKLVETWVSKGINLALARAFTHLSAESAGYILNLCMTTQLANVSKDLFTCSLRPLPIHASITFAEFTATFCNANARWETLGLFFVAVSRAASDIRVFEPLYKTEQQRRSFQKLAMQHSDRCLEISLSLDCLNDIQLLLQYENFIGHSHVDGDQSYRTWRKLGDVVSSVFALGYHEQLEQRLSIPSFLKDLRAAAFARTYSADKNISVFLGRPPRMNRKYCRTRIFVESTEKMEINRSYTFIYSIEQPPGRSFDYMTETAWSFNCAILKERILELSRDESNGERDDLLRVIEKDTEALWLSLPARYRLEGPLRLNDEEPVERDFMVSAKLNYLHVQFMLRLACSTRVLDLDPQLLAISADILSLTVEALVLKSHLINSGTGLVWKVAYYGLPAAGIICLFLLQHPASVDNWSIDTSKISRDLSVLVAEVDTGALVRIEEPNFALLAEATRAIKSILDRVLFAERRSASMGRPLETNPEITAQPDLDWLPWANLDTWDFERDFWLNLTEHPILAATEIDADDLET